ncbi:MAG: hypothetical protein HY465_05725 [Deltaproteobacteria bacterium]|nr:hypothetical protein [Deltaproteobacteria bacterium]
MSKWWMALICNALVFPGSGYFVIKEPRRGWIITGLSALALTTMIISFVMPLTNVLPLLPSSVPLNPTSLAEAAVMFSWKKSQTAITLLSTTILLLWVFGILDCLVRRKAILKTYIQKSPPL